MSRAHVQGFDSNAAQFERMGNPWVSERDRCEFSAPNKKERRQNRNGAKPILGNFPEPERRPERSSRSEGAAMEQTLRSRRFMAAFKSGLPEGTRTVAPAVDRPKVWEISQHPANTELRTLTSEQRDKRGWQRMNAAAKRIAAEEAFRVSEAGRAAEKARVKALIKALEGRLASLG
jgi:hypothetical protein